MSRHEDREELRSRLNESARRERERWPEARRDAHAASREAAANEARRIVKDGRRRQS